MALAPGLGTPNGHGNNPPGIWARLYCPGNGWGREEPWSDLPSLHLSVSLEWGLCLPPRAAERLKDTR